MLSVIFRDIYQTLYNCEAYLALFLVVSHHCEQEFRIKQAHKLSEKINSCLYT
ncbi:unnamed protein product [Moneuplotes crassus]|uniref:Uncharacterized protein n=1 Tax=Euplotes crassus TaxID=5936 RepID=A0AAD2D399_EUPCR|nr:unnamed protein product [Moneuplotes crassus]